ncbi:ribonuclease H-like domain-containing protein [Tanacetum coccineum]
MFPPFVQHVDELNHPITPHPTTPPSSPPQSDTPPSHNSTPIPTSAQTQPYAQMVDSHTPIPLNNSSQTMSTHPMVTRAKAGIFKPLERMNCHVTTASPLPCSHVHALRDPNWKETMYKALLVANGCIHETFSLMVKPATIHTILILVVSRDWLIHQLDVKNAFLHGHLSETVSMHQPPGFVDSNKPDYLCYTNDIILTSSSLAFLQWIIASLHKEILERAHMQHCNPCRTPVDIESKLSFDGDPVSDLTLYRSLAGALQYPTFTRPDISYYVQHVCLYMHDLREPYFTALKRILCYVHGTIAFGLQLHASSIAQLTAYTNADWVGCPITRRSSSGYCVFLGDNLLSWSAKRQVTLSRSSTEAEYHSVVNVVAETAWLRNLLLELHAPLTTATLVYYDNVSVVYLSTNPVHHQRTKHIEIDIHFVRDYVASG